MLYLPMNQAVQKLNVSRRELYRWSLEGRIQKKREGLRKLYDVHSLAPLSDDTESKPDFLVNHHTQSLLARLDRSIRKRDILKSL